MAAKNHGNRVLGGRLDEALSELRQCERKTLRKPAPAACHELRTASRRLRGVIEVMERGLPAAARVRIDKRSRALTKLPAGVRDLDVALELLARMGGDLRPDRDDAERRALADARRVLKRRRTREAHRLQQTLDEKRPVSRLARSLRDLGTTARRAPRPIGAGVDPILREGRARIASWLGRAEDGTDIEAVHELRLAVKKYRNALLAAQDIHPTATATRPLRLLKRVQDVLGAYHDFSELDRRLQKRRAKLARKGHSRLCAGYDGLLQRARASRDRCFRTFARTLQDRLALLASVAHAPARRAAAPVVVAAAAAPVVLTPGSA